MLARDSGTSAQANNIKTTNIIESTCTSNHVERLIKPNFQRLNKAGYSAKAANRVEGYPVIVHIIFGSPLICFGIADRAVEYAWMGDGCFGTWIGVWVSCACDCYMAFIRKACKVGQVTRPLISR